MAEDKFDRGLKKRQQISITVVGRRSGRTITLPVWFVSTDDGLLLLPVYGSQTQWYRNLRKTPPSPSRPEASGAHFEPARCETRVPWAK